MMRFALAIEYLMGYSIAAEFANHDKPEWPPHPARVFMALAAAHFETDDSPENKQAEREALEWLAGLNPPALALPKQAASEFASPRETLVVYVPVNDATGIETLPTKRPRQPRTFPRMFVGEEPIRLVWSTEDKFAAQLYALERVCRKVTRIGHPSSLVWVRLERNFSANITHEPSDDAMDNRLRITSKGTMGRLGEAFAASQHPIFSISRGYSPIQAESSQARHSPFDPNLVVLKEAEDSPLSFGLESTLLITQALRGLIQKECGIKPIPDWISGHDGPAGSKLADGRGHIALIPLPFVQEWRRNERQYADGHVMGVAIVIPREVPARERAKALGPILFDEKTSEPRMLKLVFGRAGELFVQRETSFSPQLNLQPLTWTQASRRWVSVTPVVLDGIPKSDRQKERHAWNKEVADLIRSACAHQQLPEPIAVRIERTPFLVGSLRAMPGQGGFALLRPGTFQVHVEIEFNRPVEGPILLGAGRFRGYGLCRPMRGET